MLIYDIILYLIYLPLQGRNLSKLSPDEAGKSQKVVFKMKGLPSEQISMSIQQIYQITNYFLCPQVLFLSKQTKPKGYF